MKTIDIGDLSVVHTDQLIEQIRVVLSEEEKEAFSKEMETINTQYQTEINNIQIEQFSTIIN